MKIFPNNLIKVFLFSTLLWVSQAAGITFIQGAEELFKDGLESYKEGDFQEARESFAKILKFPENQRSSAAQLMLGKSIYKLQEYDKAIETAKALLKKYPESRYFPYAIYLIGNCYFRKGDFPGAIIQYHKILKSEAKKGLKQKARYLIDKIVKSKLSWAEIEKLKAKGLLKSYKQPEPAVGIICPLSGSHRPFGEDLLNGVKLALPKEIELIVKDSKSSSVGAVKAAQELSSNPRIIAIIGPVFSSPAIAAAAVANSYKIPLIAPVANQDGIASIGKYVFQLNTTPRIQGKKMAEYAISKLKLKTFAVLAPLSPRGEEISDGFTKTARSLGGKIILRQWYAPGSTDFGRQFKNIREAGLMRLPSDSLQSIKAFQDTTETLVPVETIDGLMVIGTPSSLSLIAPQIAFYRINAQILGASGWNSEDLLNKGGEYVEGAVFVSEYFKEETSFALNFKEKYGREPTKVSAFGYDAASLLFKVYKQAGRDRETISQMLNKTEEFKGASGNISMNKGANESVYLLTIKDGEIVKWEERK